MDIVVIGEMRLEDGIEETKKEEIVKSLEKILLTRLDYDTFWKNYSFMQVYAPWDYDDEALKNFLEKNKKHIKSFVAREYSIAFMLSKMSCENNRVIYERDSDDDDEEEEDEEDEDE